MPGEKHFSQLLDFFLERKEILESIGGQQVEVEKLLASVEYELQGLRRHLAPVLPTVYDGAVEENQKPSTKSRAA